MSTDGFPQAHEAMEVGQEILRVAHAAQVTLPTIELTWHEGVPSLEVKWFPTIGPVEDSAVLLSRVRDVFVTAGEEMYDIGTSASYQTDLHGIDVEFTVYTH